MHQQTPDWKLEDTRSTPIENESNDDLTETNNAQEATMENVTFNSNPDINAVRDLTNLNKHDGYKYLIAFEFGENFCDYEAGPDVDEEALQASPEYAAAQETYEDWMLVQMGWKREEVYLDWKDECEVWVSTNKAAKQSEVDVEVDEEVTNNQEAAMSNDTEYEIPEGVKLYEVNGVKGVSKEGAQILVGFKQSNQLVQKVRAGEIDKLGNVPYAPGDNRILAIFDLDGVMAWAEEFKPKEQTGYTRWQLSLADEDMALVIKFLSDSKIKFDVENLSKKSREAAKRHHAKVKQQKAKLAFTKKSA